MSRNAFDAIEHQYNEAEDYRATAKQEREMEAIRRDAERYRWLREQDWEIRTRSPLTLLIQRTEDDDVSMNSYVLDSAIDAAIKEQK